MRAVVFNLGCKVNQYECDVLEEQLAKRGYEVFSELVPAEIYVINTCAVTAEAERKSRQAIARCEKLNENAKIFICGCASQKNAKPFCKGNVVFVTGTAGKEEIFNHLDDEAFNCEINALPTVYEPEFLTIPRRTRAYIKIQDGCNNFCSYCIIPYLRGRSRSRQISDIVSEAEKLSSDVKELVLTGINLSHYGEDTGASLPELIDSLKGLDVRIRLGSFYVEVVNERLLDSLFSLKKFCPHFHLSLQSGCDKVLKDMNRHYSTVEYRERVNLIRKYDNNASVCTDVIVGFPTETENDFNVTYDFLEEIAFGDIHVFPYSSREGTLANRKYGALDSAVVNARKAKLLGLKRKLHDAYLLKNIGVEQNVLIESRTEGMGSGYSERYIRVYTQEEGDSVKVVPKEKFRDGLR